MKKRTLALPFVVISLLGCAMPQMKEVEYEATSLFLTANRKCFDVGLISPTAYSQGKDAMMYLVSQTRHDKDRLDAMVKSSYEGFTPDTGRCRYVEAGGAGFIASAARDRRSSEINDANARQNLRDQINNAAANRPVNCTRIGNMTSCN